MEASSEKKFRDTVLDEIGLELTPDLKRKVFAATRLLVIKKFEEYSKKESERLGKTFSKNKAVKEFCHSLGINRGTYYGYLRRYRNGGITAFLQPRRPRNAEYVEAILPIVLKIMEPRKGYKTTRDKLLPICRQKGLKAPSYNTFKAIADSNGLADILLPRKKVYFRKSREIHLSKKTQVPLSKRIMKDGRVVWATLRVEINDPLSCLNQLRNLIKQEPSIPPDRKELSLDFFRRQNNIVSPDHRNYGCVCLHRSLTLGEKEVLDRYKTTGLIKERRIATGLLMISENRSLLEIMMETGCSRGTIYKWLRKFKKNGIGFIKTKVDRTTNNEELRERPERLLRILRDKPKDYGINRTTWIQKDLVRVYEKKYGKKLCQRTIRDTLKKVNHTWKSTRMYVPSRDPEYREKIKKVLHTLQNMGPKDAFFFIDEAGPYQVKKYGGKSWTEKGTTKFVPQFQTSKGSVTLIGALNAVKNQVVMFFTKHKDTKAVVALIRVLYFKYMHCDTLHIT